MVRVLVLGATGRQGSTVAQQLIAHGHEASALVRDTGSPNASTLGALGVRMVTGDLRDPAAVRRAVVGHDAVFGLTVPFGPGGRAEEIQSGKALVDAAAKTHLVFSSVRDGDRLDASGVDHADSKQVVEAYLRDRPVRSTVIGPVYFMDNALMVDSNGLHRGVLSTPLSPNKRLDQVAVADIAGRAVYAIEHPATMIGRKVDIASDSVTGTEAARILSRVIGRDIPYAQLPLDAVQERAGQEFVSMWDAFERFERNEYFLAIASLHADYPEAGWHSFEEWALTLDWEKYWYRERPGNDRSQTPPPRNDIGHDSDTTAVATVFGRRGCGDPESARYQRHEHRCPSVEVDLGGSSFMQWLGSAYTLSLAAGLLVGGRLGDMFGHRAIYCTGIAGFVTASLICGLATNPSMMIAARVLQRFSAAVVLPQSLGVIRTVFPVDKLSKAFAAYGPLTSLATLIGPVLVEMLVSADLFGWGWRSIFFVNIPVGIVLLAT